MTASNALPRPDAVPVRQTAIDYMKAFLVIGMVLAHALQLLSKPRGLAWLFSVGINLITFSGFCFGYVFYLVYLTKPVGLVRSQKPGKNGSGSIRMSLYGFVRATRSSLRL